MKAKKTMAVLCSVGLAMSLACGSAFALGSTSGKTNPVIIKDGATITIGGNATYVADKVGKTVVVKYTKVAKKNATTATIPSYITVKGKKYKVTSISTKMLKSTKVKTLTVKATKIKASSIKKAVKGTKVKTIKVPKSMYKTYKKIFKNSKIKIKKI